MGKKSKRNKFAKMSDEERARYLQMRADMEEEARRRKMQLISMYMKNKLKREEAFCRLNMAKINQTWRSILRQVKCEELRKDIIEMEMYCKEKLEHKDKVVRRLLDDMEVAYGQHDNLSQTHLETMQHFINIQQQRLEFFRENYESEKEYLVQEFEDGYQKLKDMTTAAKEHLEYVYYQLDDANEKERKESYEKFLERLDDIKAEMQIRVEKITDAGEEKLQKLWQEYQKALSDYVAYTEGFYADYMDLKEQDDEYSQQLRQYSYEIEKANNQLASLKLTLADAEEKSAVRIKYLESLREHLSNKLNEVKEQVDAGIKDNEAKFKLTSVMSHKAVKFFKTLCDKGNSILQLAAACRKYETEREKILPLGLPPLKKVMFQNTAEEIEQMQDNQIKDGFYNWFLMENFWKRVNNVKVDVMCLIERKKSLQLENKRLKTELQERLINLNISNGTNNHIDDYLAKRPSSMRVERVERLDLDTRKQCKSADVPNRNKLERPFSCVTEANFTNAVRSKILAKGKQKLGKITVVKHDVFRNI